MKCSKPKRTTPGGPNHGGTLCVITTHNYTHFLRECLVSCLNQTLPFAKVVVIDDASEADPWPLIQEFKGVQLKRVNFGDVVRSRIAGLAAPGEFQFYLFVDADNWLSPECHKHHRQAMNDPSVGVAYGELRRFEDVTGAPRGVLKMSWNYNALRKENYVDTCSLVRREAYEQAGGWEPTPGAGGLEDWSLWLRITRLGWSMALTPGVLHYRVHKAQMSATQKGTTHERNARCLTASATVTIVTLMAGRTWALRQQVKAVKELQWRRTDLRWLILDNSGSETFYRALWDTYLADMEIPTSVIRVPEQATRHDAHRLADSASLRSANAYAINTHLARLYARARGLCACDTDFVLCLEDDILPPENTLFEMMIALQQDRGAGVISGCVMSRFAKKPHLLAWQGEWADTGRMEGHEHVTTAPAPGVNVRITAAGFMCTLFRRQVWDALTFRPGPLWTKSNSFYDWAAAHEVERLGWRWLLCGGVRCVHLQANGNNLSVPDSKI